MTSPRVRAARDKTVCHFIMAVARLILRFDVHIQSLSQLLPMLCKGASQGMAYANGDLSIDFDDL